MIDDHQLSALLRAALPPADQIDEGRPPHDLWPAVVQRASAREAVSTADVSVAAIVAIALLMFPQWFWFLAYHV